MKTTPDSKTLATAIKLAPCCKGILPVLEHCRLTENNGALNLRSTDLDNWLDADIPGITSGEAALIPLSALKLKAKNVSLEATNGHCDIVADGSSQRVPTLPLKEFPAWPQVPENAASIPIGLDFFASLKACTPAMPTDDRRYVLNGVSVEVHGNGVNESLSFIAIDGHRMHVVNAREGAPRQRFIIPSGAVKWLLKFKPSAGTLRIWKDKEGAEWFQVDLGWARATSHCVDGNYPNWRQVVPMEFKESVTFMADELAAAVASSARCCTPKSASVRLEFTRHLLTIKSKSDLGESSATVATNYNGKDQAIALIPKFLQDACGMGKSAECRLEFIDEVSPIKITTGNRLAIVMLMRMT